MHVPNGQHIQSIGTTTIDWPTLPSTATKAHILPDLNPHSLVSIGVLCDHDCTATFNKHAVTIHCHNQPILTGPRLPNGLWSLPLQTNHSHHHANTLFTPQTNKNWSNGFMPLLLVPAPAPSSMPSKATSSRLDRASPPKASDATYPHLKPP